VTALTLPGYEARFSRLAEIFDGQIAQGLHPGAQICVRHRGEIVFERWGGHRDSARRHEVDRDTMFMVYSSTKAFTAACVHKLADEGLLDLDQPVARYWPAFGVKGKEGITIAHVLLHQAGIPRKGSMAEALSWLVPGEGARRAARMTPIHEPGARCVYHSFTGGFVLGELIRRVSGVGAARYLEENFLKPLEMSHSHAGLPLRDYGRASRLYSADPDQKGAARVFSNPLHRSLYLPAASLNSTARDISLFYQMLLDGGISGGTRYLSAAAIANATKLRYEGPDGDSGRTVRWGYGFVIGGYAPFPDKDIRHMGRRATETTFGHAGQGGCSIGWADTSARLAFSFTCNGFLDLEHGYRRFQALADAVRDAV